MSVSILGCYYHRDGLKRHWLNLWRGWNLRLEFGRLGWPFADVEWGYRTEGVQISVALWLYCSLTFGVPFKFQHALGRWWPKESRQIGIKYSDSRLRLELLTSPWGEYKFLRRWWRPFWSHNELTLFNTKWIVGRDKHSNEIITPPVEMQARIDGKAYPLLISRERTTWRNRIRTMRREFWDIKIPEGTTPAQFAGKGENSWDCDDDGIYGMSTAVKSGQPREAVWAYEDAVIRNRRRYGMPQEAAGG